MERRPNDFLKNFLDGWAAEHGDILCCYQVLDDGRIELRFSYHDETCLADDGTYLRPGEGFYNLSYEELARQRTGAFHKKRGERAFTLLQVEPDEEGRE
ncbi:MAG: hypothetical protein RMK81_11250 [Geminicoccaceae bacterium]|nr:hypothetical protein [Gammaproteobacteria bacterium]MDW8370839.1 hypothetical protein [Geminicoccaceae bacterium]